MPRAGLGGCIAVMYEGEIMGIVPPTTDKAQLGLMMAGTRLKAPKDGADTRAI